VDVPGHERFVRHMLAGVGGIDLVLLVIAADEAIKPQTREHFDICRLLRIPRGIVVLTKIDLVEPDWLALVVEEVKQFVAGSFLEGAPVVPVSIRTGGGLDDLKRALARAAHDAAGRDAAGLLRLPIDRAFTMRGFGAVVTGTLVSGTLCFGDEVEILPQRLRARIRGLQVHGQASARVAAGQRVAVNLQGVEVGALERGQMITVPAVLEPTRVLDVALEHLPGEQPPLKDLARVTLHMMTSETPARVRILGGGTLQAGASGFAQIHCARPVVALAGDRFILRRPSPPLTIAGGTVLHNAPAKLRRADTEAARRFERLSDPSPAARLSILIEEGEAAGRDVQQLRARTGFDADPIARLLADAVRSGAVRLVAGNPPGSPPRYLTRAAAEGLEKGVRDTLAEFHRREPLREGLAREELRTRLFGGSNDQVFRALLAAMAASGALRLDKDVVALASHRIALSQPEMVLLERLETAYAKAGTNPPERDEAAKAIGANQKQFETLLHLLLQRGRLVRIPDGKIFHADALDALKRRLWERRARGEVLDIGEFKDLSGTSRKNAIPLLEYLDQIRVTRRDGNQRVILPPPTAPASTPVTTGSGPGSAPQRAMAPASETPNCPAAPAGPPQPGHD
jgi:selenocysteine-specific elongation factor